MSLALSHQLSTARVSALDFVRKKFGRRGDMVFLRTTFELKSEFSFLSFLVNFPFRFQNQLYTLVVSAHDSGDDPQTSSVLVYFNVKDTNDNTPLFEHGTYSAEVYENITIGTSVLQVIALDIDSGMFDGSREFESLLSIILT